MFDFWSLDLVCGEAGCTFNAEARRMSCILLNQDHISWLIGRATRFPFLAEIEVLEGSRTSKPSCWAKCRIGHCHCSSPGVSGVGKQQRLPMVGRCWSWSSSSFQSFIIAVAAEAASDIKTGWWVARTLPPGQPRWPWPRLHGGGHHGHQGPRAPGLCQRGQLVAHRSADNEGSRHEV